MRIKTIFWRGRHQHFHLSFKIPKRQLIVVLQKVTSEATILESRQPRKVIQEAAIVVPRQPQKVSLEVTMVESKQPQKVNQEAKIETYISILLSG